MADNYYLHGWPIISLFRNVFWRDPVVRRQLEARLEQRWRLGLCTRVEVAE